MDKPIINQFNSYPTMRFQQYERYLPSAFDETLSFLQKLNLIIKRMNQLGEVSNSIVDQWNQVMEWIESDGLNEATANQLIQWLNDGTLNTIINQTIFNGLSSNVDKLVKRSFGVSIEEYGAISDYNSTTLSGTDVAPSIQQALDAVKANGGGYVLIPPKPYVLRSQIHIYENCYLVGNIKGLKAGYASTTSNGDDRYKKSKNESFLFIIPNDISVSPILMDESSYLGGVGLFYPQARMDTSDENFIIHYAPTISALAYSMIENIRTWGSYDFIDANGSGIVVRTIYGYNFGCAFNFHDSQDVCRLEDIHMNPNVVRPSQALIDLAKARTNSILVKINNVDGLFISKIHSYAYRTIIKCFGGSGGAQSQFILSDFLFDVHAVTFDIDSDSGWACEVSNGLAIFGWSNSNDYSGFLRLNKTTNTTMTPIHFSNVEGLFTNGGMKPNYVINFLTLYNYHLTFSSCNLYYDDNLISDHQSFVEGELFYSNFTLNLSDLYKNRNLLFNEKMEGDTNTDGVPDNWTVNADQGTITVTPSSTGFKWVTTDLGVADSRGIMQRITLVSASSFRAKVKIRQNNSGGTAKIYVVGYDDTSYTNPLGRIGTFDSNGFADVLFNEQKQVIDVYVVPGNNAGNAVLFEYAQVVAGDTRNYIAVK